MPHYGPAQNRLGDGHVNLTKYEISALSAPISVSDGHPRQQPTAAQAAILGRLTDLFIEGTVAPFEELEKRVQATFLRSLGQHTRAVDGGRVLSAYASSVAMDVLARTLAENAPRVGLITPTFDNIPDLLKRWRLPLVPLAEEALVNGEIPVPLDQLDTVFITTPNNPTGTYLGPEALRSIAEQCARAGLLLAMDVCFRGFERRFQYDVYTLLDEVGVEWVLIEDTGKLWPTSELKAGFLSFSANCRLDLADAMSDVLLSVSPFVLRLIEEFALDGAAGGFDDLHALVRRNQETVARVLAGSSAAVTDPDSRISCVRVTLPPELSAEKTYRDLQEVGLHLLPCGPFHWDDNAAGERYLRIALGRDPEVIEQAATALTAYLDQRAR